MCDTHRFIFEHFEYFTQDDRIIHLHHIYVHYLHERPAVTLTAEEREQLVYSLRDLAFLEDEDGELQCASYFHDPENVIFRIMLPSCRFAPRVGKLFAESEWYRSVTGTNCRGQ